MPHVRSARYITRHAVPFQNGELQTNGGQDCDDLTQPSGKMLTSLMAQHRIRGNACPVSPNSGNGCSLGAMLCSRTVAHVLCLEHVQITRVWAAVSAMVAAPHLLGHGPSLHEVGEPSIAIVLIGRSRSIVTTASVMHVAAPPLLLTRPFGGPVRVAICAIVGIHGTDRSWYGGWLVRVATDAHERTAALLLGGSPLVLPVHLIDLTLVRRPNAPEHCQQAEQQRQHRANEACEVAPAAAIREVATIAHEAICGISTILALPTTNERHLAAHAHSWPLVIAVHSTCIAVTITSIRRSHREGSHPKSGLQTGLDWSLPGD